MNTINDFHGAYFFLSNFYEKPFWYNGQKWKTVEHAFQAAKCIDVAEQKKIHEAKTPGDAKKFGRKALLIPGWDEKRIDVMRNCLLMKFMQNDDLLVGLLGTGDVELVEGNIWHDNYWGDCHCDKCKNRPGENMLGTMLMEIRNNARHGNYIWCVRNLNNGGEITQYFKTRDRALAFIATEANVNRTTLVNPYECNNWRLDVICLTE